VPGGTYFRKNDGATSGTVSDFLLDKYEVTVGRFRKFVAAYPGSKPPPNVGAHPKIAGSGWNQTWDPMQPVSQGLLIDARKCNGYATWTDAPGAGENKPINCIDWYTAFSFCAWDGGRLPTDLEWNYAAAGGSEQRIYPWGDTAPAFNTALAIYGCLYNGTGSCSVASIAPVGTVPAGNGKWGHADLAGNMQEWLLDFYASTLPPTCVDCANLMVGNSSRVLRGGAFNQQATTLRNNAVNGGSPPYSGSDEGVRCARTP